MSSFLMTGVSIYTGNKYIEKGYIYIVDGIIEKIGEGRVDWELGREADSFQSFENRKVLVSPGLVNSHTHTGMAYLRGVADDVSFEEWLFNQILPREDLFSEEDVYWASLLSQLEMIKNGITCFCDMYVHTSTICRTVEETGMRALITRGLTDNAGDNGRLAENVDTFERWHGKANDRIRVGFGPHAPYTCSMDYLSEIAAAASERGAIVNIHLKEAAREADMYSFRQLEETGLFRNRTLAVHCVYVNEEDMNVMAENGIYMIHNPSSNLKLANGFAPIKKIMDKNIPVALGTDSVASNNSLDIWREMLLSSLIHKGIEKTPTIIPAKTALNFATECGAKALGFDKVGKLEEGYKADLILIDLENISYHPAQNIESHLVYSGRSSDVLATMVDGEWLYYFGKYPNLDESRIKFEIAERSFRIDEEFKNSRN